MGHATEENNVQVLRLFGVVAMVAIALTTGAMAQESMYVTDVLKITVRSGPSNTNRVIATLTSGDKVLLLQRNDEGWGKVRTPDGKEGWVIHRYLIKEKPARVVLADMKPSQAQEELAELRQQNRDLKAALAEAQAKVSALEARYNQLKRDSGQTLRLRTELDQLKVLRDQQVKALKATVQQQAQRLKEVESENETMRFSGGLKWFLSGAGVLLLGWIIGWSLGRRRKRQSSSLY